MSQFSIHNLVFIYKNLSYEGIGIEIKTNCQYLILINLTEQKVIIDVFLEIDNAHKKNLLFFSGN